MVRYERTGEHREVNLGEWFESECWGPLRRSVDAPFCGNKWILRRLESPAAEPSAARPGTEALVQWIQTKGERPVAQAEVIRILRAWEKAREVVSAHGMAELDDRLREWKSKLLALLDAEHAEET